MDEPKFPPLLDPERVFERPCDVVGADYLTREQKLQALNQWEETLQSKLRSAGEGMTAVSSAPDAELMEEIAKARKALGVDGTSDK